jgi:hypothetical protein
MLKTYIFLLSKYMNYYYIPQKFVMKQPVYSNNQICPICNSNNSYPIINMIGSPRHCNNCKNTFNAQISRYEEVIVEK